MIKPVQSRELSELYHGHSENCTCGLCKDAQPCISLDSDSSIISLSDDIIDTNGLINQALINIFSGTVPPSGVEPNLWRLTYETLNKAVDEGFGKVLYESPDFNFVWQLKHNNSVFAAFAAYNQQKELAANLLDETGKLKPFYQFKKDTSHIVAKHSSHRQIEYNTAVKRARSAQQFKQFEKTAHLYPNITWLPSRAAHPDQIHRGYYGITLPINDAFWISNYPGCRWGCKCGWEASDADVTGYPETMIPPSPGLDENPVKTGAIFSRSHPYTAEATKKAFVNMDKEVMKLERKLTQEWAKQKLAGKTFGIGNIAAKLTTRGIKEILNQPHKNYSAKNNLLFSLKEVFAKAKPAGTQLNDKAIETIKQFYYFEIEIAGEPSWIVVREMANGEMQVYSIVDALKKNG